MFSDKAEEKIVGLLEKGRFTLWEIFDELDLLELDVVNALNKLWEEGEIGIEDYKLFLNGRDYRNLNYERPLQIKFELSEEYKEVLRKYKELTGQFIAGKSEFYQERILSEHVIRKIAFIENRGDLKGRDFLLIGDDDFMSIALALTGKAGNIHVADIDQDVLDKVKGISDSEGFGIEVTRHDLREELPEKLKQKFDAYITAPPETAEGNLVFNARGMEALKGKGCIGYLEATNIEASLKKWMEWQKAYSEANAVFTDIVRQFAVYPDKPEGFDDMEELKRQYQSYELVKRLPFNPGFPNVHWWKVGLIRIELIDDYNQIFEGRKEFEIYDEETLTNSFSNN